jgi:hypothetical protein
MKSINWIVLGVAAMIVYISKESAALSCLQCEYNPISASSDWACNDPPRLAAKACINGVACTKLYIKSKSGMIGIQRGCDTIQPNNDIGDPTNSCQYRTQRGATVIECECLTDGCNFAVSSIFPLPMVAILCLSLGAAVLANYT